jgi:nitroreductase
MNDAAALSRILDARHSCRAFRSDPLPDALIEEIITEAGKVPSWCNAQPWQVVVTKAGETDRLRAALAEAVDSTGHAPDLPFPDRYEGVYKQRRSDCGWALYDAVGVTRGDRTGSAQQMRQNFRFFGAPHVALVTSEAALGPYGVLDCGAFITGVTLAATARGVATIPQAAIASYAPLMHRFFDLSETRVVLCAIALGYADTGHKANSFRTTRAPLGEVLRWQG